VKFRLPLRFLLSLVCLGLVFIHEPVLAKSKNSAKTHKLSKNSLGKSAKVQRKLTARLDSGLNAAPRTSSRTAKYRLVKRGGKVIRLARVNRVIVPAKPSLGKAIGLHSVDDPLDLRSGVAVVVDGRSNEVLFAKNPAAVLPIASITKLMTAMVTLDAGQSLSEILEISSDDLNPERYSRSRLAPGSRLTRAEMMQLALMASENRAAYALARNFPGGLQSFLEAMNNRAKSLGMRDTRFLDPTGLSSGNVSSGQDLVKLVQAAAAYPIVRQYSTASELAVDTGIRALNFRNTNRLIDSSEWQIALSKTGYISEAGNCLVMQTRIEGRPLIMVLLDADGRRARYGDAERLRNWLETAPIKARNQVQPGVPIQARTL
jgi:serine-type D-Ala-D-Ala endopeptidase (penicillin-binding protein 7)